MVQSVFQSWNSGNQGHAIDVLRARAQQGEPWVAAFLSWLLMQQGAAMLNESVDWAIQAAQCGYPSQLNSVFQNLMGNLPSNPQLAYRLPELFELGIPWSAGIDVIGNAWNLLSSGQNEVAVRLMMMPSRLPLALVDASLNSVVDQANRRLHELNETTRLARTSATDVVAAADHAREVIHKSKEDLETSAQQAGLLVATATSDATNSLFKEDARRNTKESKAAWIAGLIVLAGAATVAVLPVVLHYLNVGNAYSAFEKITLHLVSTAALGAFAGVLLARARARDQAAQRAHDLSTAMGTMITYSSQISDPVERQSFMATMGQIVLQAHLASGGKSPGVDDSTAGMIALVNSIVKPGALSSASHQG